jgi:cell division protein FtsB
MSAQTSSRAIPSQSIEAPDGRASLRMSGRAVALFLVVCAVMLLGIAPLRGYLDERGLLADLHRQAATLEAQNAALQSQIDLLTDEAYLERIARQCMGMVMPGETAFVLVPTHGSPIPPDC